MKDFNLSDAFKLLDDLQRLTVRKSNAHKNAHKNTNKNNKNHNKKVNINDLNDKFESLLNSVLDTKDLNKDISELVDNILGTPETCDSNSKNVHETEPTPTSTSTPTPSFSHKHVNEEGLEKLLDTIITGVDKDANIDLNTDTDTETEDEAQYVPTHTSKVVLNHRGSHEVIQSKAKLSINIDLGSIVRQDDLNSLYKGSLKDMIDVCDMFSSYKGLNSTKIEISGSYVRNNVYKIRVVAYNQAMKHTMVAINSTINFDNPKDSQTSLTEFNNFFTNRADVDFINEFENTGYDIVSDVTDLILKYHG